MAGTLHPRTTQSRRVARPGGCLTVKFARVVRRVFTVYNHLGAGTLGRASCLRLREIDTLDCQDRS